MPGDNQFTTENFLRLNFSPKPGVTPGTNDTLWLNCDQVTARYYVSIAGTTSTGKRWPRQNQLSDSITLPTVSTGSITSPTATTATGSGTVSADGGATVTDRGIQWSIYSNFSVIAGSASGGSGTGSFTVNMTGLTANTTYYVRAYATNSVGTAISYNMSFTTSAGTLSYPAIYVWNRIETSCGAYSATSENTAKQLYLDYINPSCTHSGAFLFGDFGRVESVTVGKQIYNYYTEGQIKNMTGWYILTEGYVVYISAGVIQTIIAYPW